MAAWESAADLMLDDRLLTQVYSKSACNVVSKLQIFGPDNLPANASYIYLIRVVFEADIHKAER
jgi:hypothetical protein